MTRGPRVGRFCVDQLDAEVLDAPDSSKVAGRLRPRWGRLVQAEPVMSQGLDRIPELFIPDWLLHAAVGSKLIALGQLAGILGRCQHHDRDQAGPRVAPDRSQYIETIKLGKLE